MVVANRGALGDALAAVVAFVIFRAPDLAVAMRLYYGMAGVPQASAVAGPTTSIARRGGVAVNPSAPTLGQAILWGRLALAVLWFVPKTQQLMARFGPAFAYGLAGLRRSPPLLARIAGFASLPFWRPTLFGATVTGVLAALAFLNLQHVSQFLYFEF